MREFKGTPAPWKIEIGRKNKKAYLSGFGWGRFAMVWIATTNSVTGVTKPSEEGKANLTLIASAPELLRACESALLELQIIPCKCDPSIIQMLEIAINNAHGESSPQLTK